VNRAHKAAASASAAVVVALPLAAAGTGGLADPEPGSTAPTDPAETTPPPSADPQVERLERELAVSRRRERRARRLARFRALQAHRLRAALRFELDGAFAGLLCIHRFEGPWRDRDAPYWGGLQMDRGFMARYAPAMVQRYGTADHWPAEAQLAAGVLAVHDARGFTPWPVSSRRCGLQ
jgi:hypothetical protein